jgi:hypothetical protein
MFNRPKVTIAQWLIAELTPFASGKRSWQLWQNWLEMSGARASRELDAEWLRRIAPEPQIEVLRLLKAAGVTIVPIPLSCIKHDPLEDNEHFAAAMAEADRMARGEAGDTANRLGGCHLLWKIKKRVLKEEFGLAWQSPAELNPGTLFD